MNDVLSVLIVRCRYDEVCLLGHIHQNCESDDCCEKPSGTNSFLNFAQYCI